MPRLPFLLVVVLLAQPQVASAQDSAAARWLANEFSQTFCGGAGTFGPDGLIEMDLTGDGRDDLLLYGGGLSCANGQSPCAAVYCDANLYVREGELLVDKLGVNTQCAEVAPGSPPTITFCNNDTGPWTVRWDGAQFSQ
jgi:hypothetical protein